MLLVIVLVVVQLLRTAPPATVHIVPPAASALPGDSPDLPWPQAGTAVLSVPGIGELGRSGGDAPKPIGSVAKVMTAYLVLSKHPLEAGEPGPSLTVTAADVRDYRDRVPSGQALVPVKEGEKLTERQALEALLLPSANNIAHMLGVWVSGDQETFVDLMNATAKRLGMSDTHYTDPSGFDPGTVSTAADQVALGQKAMAIGTFAKIVAEPSAEIPVAGEVHTYNWLLGELGVVGIKTGATDQAGGNVLFAARFDVGVTRVLIIGAVFDQPGTDTPEQLDAADAAARDLLRTAEKSIRQFTLMQIGAAAGTVRTDWGASTPLKAASSATVIGWPGLKIRAAVHTAVPSDQLAAGQTVGTITFHVGTTAAKIPVKAAEPVPPPSLGWRLTRLG